MIACEPKYADAASFLTATVSEQELIARDTWRARIVCPEIASRAVPGQFVMLRLDGVNDPLIGRALAMYDRIHDKQGNPYAIDVVYLVKGKFTQAMSKCLAGTQVGLWGPLGNAFSNDSVDHLILVAGGVGYTPMLTVGREALGVQAFGTPARKSGYAKRVTLCYGARSADRLAGVVAFENAGLDVRLATDDGSIRGTTELGTPMKVTDQLLQVLGTSASNESRRIACCGPEPMMEAVAEIAKQFQIPCEVSLETPMACGIGICFTCVAKIRQSDNEWDYKRTCLEGPIFRAESVVW
jgi:dihydroorotate dehydrogenase electron transfer subunit